MVIQTTDSVTELIHFLKTDNTITPNTTNLLSVWPCIVDDMKRVKPTWCYTMVYWTLWIAQHVSGITMPIIRTSRLYRWYQRMAPHLGYGRLLVWCMAVGFWSVRLEGCFTSWFYSLHDNKFVLVSSKLATCFGVYWPYSGVEYLIFKTQSTMQFVKSHKLYKSYTFYIALKI